MSERKRGIVLQPGEGTAVGNPVGGALTFKVRSEDTDGVLAAFESVAAPGEGPPLHTHADEDEIWYALEGTFRVRLEDDVRDAPAGTFVFIPRRAVHTWQNVGETPGRVLVIFTPGGFERFFERFAREAGDAPAEAFGRIGGEIGMSVVGPPLRESHPLPAAAGTATNET
jgi:quercetin dioxygenase-like cupin family protein